MSIGYIQFRACVLGGGRQRDLFSYRAAEWAVTGLPPHIDTQNSYAILTVLEHQANAR